MRRLRPVALASAVAALAFVASCDDPAVVELLLLRVQADGSATASFEVHVRDAKDGEPAGVARRVRDRQAALLGGDDDWLGRFAAVESESDALEWHRAKGRLRTFTRTVEVSDAQALAPLFDGDGATWVFRADGASGVAELWPGRASRAPKRERDRTLRELGRFADAYAVYVVAARRLDAYATEHPAVAEALWRRAIGREKALPVEPAELPEGEREVLDGFDDAVSGLLDAWREDPREGTSLAERVRAAFHPFGALTGVELPCDADEIEGFERVDDHGYLVPELSIAEGIARLDRRWLDPDPLAAILGRQRADATGVDVAPFTDEPVATDAPAPDGAEVLRAFTAALKPPPVYRLVWSCAAPEPEPREGSAP